MIATLIINTLNWINDDERGQWYAGGGGVLGLIVALCIIVACIVFIWVNIDINEK